MAVANDDDAVESLSDDGCSIAAPIIDHPTQVNNNVSVNENIAYESHFSLRIPISSVRFRGSLLRVIDTDHDQIILKQQLVGNGSGKHNRTMLVKRVPPNTYAQRSLRIGYTLITIIFVGFLFVFCCQVLLFLAIAIPVNEEDMWTCKFFSSLRNSR